MTQNRGFLPILPAPEDYIFGASKLGGEILVEDGQWDGFLPIFELQKNELLRWDSHSCVAYARNNCLETIYKRKYGIETLTDEEIFNMFQQGYIREK